MRKSGFFLPLVSASFLIGLPATAHHSGATYFDLDAVIEHADATVVSYDIVNPHGRLVYVFTDDDGNEVQWSGELASANNLRRRGLGGNIFSPGDKLATVTGSPSRNGANFLRLTRAVFANGDIAQLTGRNSGVIRAGAE
jgi:hypothetical protein